MDMTNTQRAGLRACYTASGQSLIQRGKHFYTSFVGGERVCGSTVEKLVSMRLLSRLDGCAKITEAGRIVAQSDFMAREAAAKAVRERMTREREARTAHMMRRRGKAVLRLPYADN